MTRTREQREGDLAGERPRRAATPARAAIAELRRKYAALWAKHAALVRQARVTAVDRSGAHALASFALRSGDLAVAIADAEHVRFRSGRWHVLERDRTGWRAIAREPVAPQAAPTLLHLATAAAGALLARRAPAAAAARYERPERGDVFDVRFERLPERTAIGVSIRDVTRLVTAEREVAALLRALDEARRGERGAAT